MQRAVSESDIFPDTMRDDIERAVAMWPQVSASIDDFSAWVQEHAPEPDHLGDVFLAWAAVSRDEHAVSEVDSWVREVATRAVSVTGVRNYEPSDLEQDLLQLLIVGTVTRPPRLSSYGGRGPLKAWVRSCALRECLMRRRRASVSEEVVAVSAQLTAEDDDPELRALKARDRHAFGDALADAFRQLESSTRTLLRYYYVDGLDQQQIALIYGVHHATISRRLDRARDSIRQYTRETLSSAGHGPAVWGLVQSQLHVSLRSLLRSTAVDEG